MSTHLVDDGTAFGHNGSTDVPDAVAGSSASPDRDLVQAVVARGESAPSMWLFR